MKTVDLYPLRSYSPEVKRARPSAASSWSQVTPTTALILAHLEALGVADPTTASEHYTRALELKRAARDVDAPAISRDKIERALASGELSAKAAQRELAKLASPALAGESVNLERQTLQAAALEAYRLSLAAFRELDDGAWLELLREHVTRALDYGDEAVWETIHRSRDGLYPLLRQVGALETLRMQDRWPWICGDVTAMHRWRIARANIVDPTETRMDWQTRTEYRIALVDPPRPWTPLSKWSPTGALGYRFTTPAKVTFRVLLEHREEWRVGLYSAAEVLSQIHEIEAEHDRLIRKHQRTGIA